MKGIFLDTETNGLHPFEHRAIEIAFRILDLRDGSKIATYETVIFQPLEIWQISDPESLKVNGFSYEMVKIGKNEKDVSKEIIELFINLKIDRNNSIFICQNPSFDRIFFCKLVDCNVQERLLWPYHWLDLASMYWAITNKSSSIKFLGFSKDQIAASLNLPPETKPHRALNGVDHLILCYKNLVGFH